ncbi:MAG: AAA family ATPase [Chloroflexota bacterium]
MVSISRVVFENFKGLRNYSLTLDHMNILVGPNNAGKSTVVGAFRALAAALRTAHSKNPQFLTGPSRGFGYSVPGESIPTSLENAQTDLQDVETTITFHLSNGNRLILSFPQGHTGCYLHTEAPRRITSTTSFKEAYPIEVIVVPVLGPTEHEEEVVEQATVERNLATHRASRNFRNYWWYNRDRFDELREWVQQTWPGITINVPETSSDFKVLAMFCVEGRMTRELYWIGTGFQIWCQLLTHILRARESTLLVIDEAEIYLHPDLQRRLVSILRELGPDILVAT